MPEFSTLFRDLGTGQTIIGIAIIALIGYSIIKGGKGKGKGKGGSNSGNTTPPTPPASNS